MGLTTLLFDLDGTLLPMDNDRFTKGYFKHLASSVAHLLPPEQFVAQVWASTKAMVKSDDALLSNEQVFKADFLQSLPVDEAAFFPIIDAFYAKQFGELSHLSEPTPLAREILLAALDKGYQLVLATNPLFPRQATLHRMRWAGIDDLPFALVTTYEDSHFCKPNPNYYREIVQKLGVSSESCMMIGNDAYEDLIAGTVGMQTYWVQNGEAAPEQRLPFDQQGTLQDLLEYVRAELPALR
ncbi:FMN phosphatase YigB (HAD superfamily) [Tumebacillus sp. BK434]|uniref:HAD family hydrolase n=1 Tax=Tumebacillus sp. BK434 TaxID=2512169 RepID=UPI00104712E8|nr:HAD family hydrolase [Tumebacillus sp. BK434]TCP53790.1 FMN phosphatase YigB (HAD superfamily) [Tumebacillus sp. BK434]